MAEYCNGNVTYMKKKYYISLLLFHIYEKLVCNKFSILHTRSQSQYSFPSSLCVVVVVCFFIVHFLLSLSLFWHFVRCQLMLSLWFQAKSTLNWNGFNIRNILSIASFSPNPEYLKVLAVNYFLNDLIAMSIFCYFIMKNNKNLFRSMVIK